MCGETVTGDDVDCPHCGESLRFDPQTLDDELNPRVIRRFHAELRALVLFWMVTGLLSVAGGGALLYSGTSDLITFTSRPSVILVAIVLLATGVVWVVASVMIAMKNLSAVRMGLWVSYLSVLVNLTFLNILGIMVLFVGIMQALRVLKSGLLLQEAGLLQDRRVR